MMTPQPLFRLPKEHIPFSKRGNNLDLSEMIKTTPLKIRREEDNPYNRVKSK
jgi:hypothetical protein